MLANLNPTSNGSLHYPVTIDEDHTYFGNFGNGSTSSIYYYSDTANFNSYASDHRRSGPATAYRTPGVIQGGITLGFVESEEVGEGVPRQVANMLGTSAAVTLKIVPGSGEAIGGTKVGIDLFGVFGGSEIGNIYLSKYPLYKLTAPTATRSAML